MGGVKTRELPCLNAKHVNIDSVTCFVDITWPHAKGII